MPFESVLTGGFVMQHCCKFKSDEVYYLKDNDLFSSRTLKIGFCPICSKPVAELSEWRFDGAFFNRREVGIRANELMLQCKNQIEYSLSTVNYRKFKSKPYGWKYGLNKLVKRNKKEVIKQYACDFYGNKECIN